jgi:hypothetical protein
VSALLAVQQRSVDARNARDLSRILRISDLVDELLCQIAFIDRIEHPDSRWHPTICAARCAPCWIT